MDHTLKQKLKDTLKSEFARVGHKVVKVVEYEKALLASIKTHFNFLERLAINPVVDRAVKDIGDIDPKRDADKLAALGKNAPDGTVGIYLATGNETVKERAYVHSGAVEKALTSLIDSPEAAQLPVPVSLIEKYMTKAVKAGFDALEKCTDHAHLCKGGKIKPLKV